MMTVFEIDPKVSPGVSSSRAHETRIILDAPIETVWAALTDPAQLSRWFAPDMTVEPGAGGFMLADWGPGLAWRTEIEIWEPNRRLRLAETRDKVLSSSPVEERLEPCRLVQDYYLETEKGKTVLRLVHSGFGSSAQWDSEYEGTRGGWAACFFRLKQALKRPAESVHNFIVTSPGSGWEPARALDRLKESVAEAYQIALHGDGHCCGLLPERNGSVLSFSVQPSSDGSVAYVELQLFGGSEAAANTFKNEWKARLDRLFTATAA
jgi:uncharacterized protein YndB with AHSA1/START domain